MSDIGIDSPTDSERIQAHNLVIHRRGRGFKKGSRTDPSNGFTSVGKLQVDLLDRVGENAERSIEGWTIGITGIHREATEEDVLDRFAEFGEVKTLHLNLDRHDGYVKGYALVEYEFFDQAKEAVAKSDGAILLGQELRVDFAFVKPLEGESNDNSRLETTHSIARRLGPKVEEEDGDRDSRDQYGRRYQTRESRAPRDRSPHGRSYRNDRFDRRIDRDHPDNHSGNYRRNDSDHYSEEEYFRRPRRRSQRSLSPRRYD